MITIPQPAPMRAPRATTNSRSARAPGQWEQAAQAEAAAALPPARTGSPPGQRSQPGDPLTRQQHHVLTYLHHFLRVNHQLPPTKCIARAFGWHSNNAAQGHIERLAAKGYLEKNECGGWRFTAAGMALAPALPSKARQDGHAALAAVEDKD